MLCCPHYKGRNYFQADKTIFKLLENKSRVNSTANFFQRKYENSK